LLLGFKKQNSALYQCNIILRKKLFSEKSSFLLEVLKTWFITHIRDENTWLHCENRTKNTKGPRHPSNIIYSNRMMLGILNYKGIASCGIKG